jgi:alpha-tubulin suppressor-like RCC1 family protein
MSFSCAIRSDGTLACWGDKTSGQGSPPAGVFVDLAVGTSMEIPSKAHGCALSVDGKVTCWGDHSVGQTTPPEQTFTQLSAGDLHTCGLSVGGQLWCWGPYARQPL